LGDFDSSPMPSELLYEVKRYKSDKEETDMQLAMLEGFERGYNNFIILGGTGGRLDHTFANIELLAYAEKHGRFAALVDETNKAFLVSNKTVDLKRESGKYVSLFAYGGEATGVTLEGFKYSIKNETFSPVNPVGVSNEMIDIVGRITVEKGSLLVIISKD
ncbi:MAG: thiamine diphosphokinase, partial [Clostridiales bacterium]|nr:thiamine diphosphokinase [Clostridiales bacterium]